MELKLYGQIGQAFNGHDFAKNLADAKESGEDITLLINSGGGSVEQGLSIVSEILTSEKPITAHITGMAASMAGVIALACQVVKMNDFARIMVHNVSGGGDNEKDKRARKELNNMLAQILSRRGFSQEKMQKLMNVESWIGAMEAKEWGLIDEIVPTMIGHKAEAIIRQKKTTEEIVNELMNVVDKPDGVNILGNISNFKNHKSVIMDSILTALNVRDENAAFDKIKELQDQIKSLEAKNEESGEALEALKKEKEEIEASIKATNKANVESLVDSAIKEGKIKKEAKDQFVADYAETPEKLRNVLDNIATSTSSAIDNLTGNFQGNVEPGAGDADKAKKYEELIKNPEAAKKMQQEDPERFNALFEAYVNA